MEVNKNFVLYRENHKFALYLREGAKKGEWERKDHPIFKEHNVCMTENFIYSLSYPGDGRTILTFAPIGEVGDPVKCKRLEWSHCLNFAESASDVVLLYSLGGQAVLVDLLPGTMASIEGDREKELCGSMINFVDGELLVHDRAEVNGRELWYTASGAPFQELCEKRRKEMAEEEEEKSLRKFPADFRTLPGKIAALTMTLAEKDFRITQLERKVGEKEERITALERQVTAQNEKIQRIHAMVRQLSTTISAHERLTNKKHIADADARQAS